MKLLSALTGTVSIFLDMARQIATGMRHLRDRRNQPAVLLVLALMLMVWGVLYLVLRYDHLLHLSRMPFARCTWTDDLQALAVMILGVVFGLFSFVSIGEVMVTLDRKKRNQYANWRLALLYSGLAIGSGIAVLSLTLSNC